MMDTPTPRAGAASPGPRRTRIKICGVTSTHMVNVAADAGADAVGFVLVPESPRHITMERAEAIRRVTPPFVSPVAVFQDDDPMRIVSWPGTWVQLHGIETEEETTLPQSVIKAIPFDPVEIQRWQRCKTVAAFLIDASDGGSGQAFDHDALAELMSSITKPVIIAGGLTPENVGKAITTIRPYGVDVSSGVESSPGVKDASLIREFCAAVREADGQ